MAPDPGSTRNPHAAVARPVRAGDALRLGRFLAVLPPDSPHLRFLDRDGDPRSAARRAAQPAGVDGGGALVEIGGRIVAHGAFLRLYGPRAEVSLLVSPDCDATVVRGLLVAELAKLAEAARITSLLIETEGRDGLSK